MVFKDIFQLYKIGKELGLSRKEINSTLLFKNRYPLILALMLIVFLTVFAILFWNVALIPVRDLFWRELWIDNGQSWIWCNEQIGYLVDIIVV